MAINLQTGSADIRFILKKNGGDGTGSELHSNHRLEADPDYRMKELESGVPVVPEVPEYFEKSSENVSNQNTCRILYDENFHFTAIFATARAIAMPLTGPCVYSPNAYAH
jgi:hypothetical protein